MEGIRPIFGVAGMDLHLDLDNQGQRSTKYLDLAKRQRLTASIPEVEQEEDPYAGYFV